MLLTIMVLGLRKPYAKREVGEGLDIEKAIWKTLWSFLFIHRRNQTESKHGLAKYICVILFA